MYDHRNVGTHIIVIELPAPLKKKKNQHRSGGDRTRTL
jgi:hypothetical protein